MINKCFVRLLTSMIVVMIPGSLSTTTANASYPILMLDISNRNVASQTEPGFTSFTLADSGSEVDGIMIELAGTLDARWRGAPTGIGYELIYRDFIFSRPGGMTVTLSGLQANQVYEITIYAYDTGSAGDRIGEWTSNGEHVLTTAFNGGIAPRNEYDNAFTGTAQSDDTGTIVLECGPGEGTIEESGASNPFGFMNALVVSSMTPLTKARRPEPADGVLHSGTEVSLGWLPGGYAVLHNVYFGDNFINVDSATTGDTETFIGSTTDSFFLLGSAGSPYPEGLPPGTTYYWRIDEVNDLHTDSPWKGDVWSFTVPSKTAFNPIPVDGVMFVDPNITLSWIPGADSVMHQLYFGDNLQDVQAGAGGTDKGSVTTASFNPGLLEIEKTYYWRVDEFDGSQTHTGNVWSFTTTLEGLGTVVLDMWEGIAGSTLNLLLENPSYPDDPTWSDALTEFGTADSIGDSYGARIHGWLYAPLTGEYTFWFSSADQGELWMSTDDDPTNVQLLASEPVWGSYDTFSRQSEPVSLTGGNKYYIMTLWKEGPDWDHCQVAWRGAGIREQEIIQGSYLSPYEPINAFGPVPTDGAIDVRRAPVLGWKPGKHAASHDVYFGTDQEAVRNAGTGSPEYKVTGDIGAESFDPGELELETTYYWRIDEVNNLNPDSPWVGEVWSFTTGSFLIVDDFEDYNDYPPDEIYSTWMDGYEIETNGALVGYNLDQADFIEGKHIAETTIVHGGRQSMPYFYNNVGTATYSQAERQFGPAQDWTREGVTELSLWFRGYPGLVGSFTEGPAGTYTITASGADITGQADEFHYAYKMLTGPGSIIARVMSVDNTDPWAKAGVMIRETLEPGSKHAFVCVTPGSGVASEGRTNTGGDSFTASQAGITAPHWVKLERDVSGNFTASHSADGSTWTPVENAMSQGIQMSASVYIGLAVTSHNTDATCEAQFSNVNITGNVSQQQWMNQDIGITSNGPEPMYVVLNGSAVVYNENPDASLIDEWTEWRIDLQAFADQGVDLTNVNSIGIGIGTQDNTTTGDSGTMYFDDIRLYRP
ncbi:MAG TPA: PA14 domain-containing protein [Sedimentisphaerales bacterium]|nr:PA14 domain-containing protein [Sedimentisphaerales bacterium]